MPADQPYYSLPSTDALRSLEVDPQTGLSDDEVKSRREQYGANELHHAQRRSIWLILLEQFKSVVIIILALAGIAALVTAQWTEAAAIAAVERPPSRPS